MKSKRPTYDERRANYYGHQGANLASRDEMLEKRGVKKGTPNLPKMDATHKGAEKRLRQGDAHHKAFDTIGKNKY